MLSFPSNWWNIFGGAISSVLLSLTWKLARSFQKELSSEIKPKWNTRRQHYRTSTRILILLSEKAVFFSWITLIVRTGNLSTPHFHWLHLRCRDFHPRRWGTREREHKQTQSHLTDVLHDNAMTKEVLSIPRKEEEEAVETHSKPIKCVFKYCDFKVRYSIEKLKWKKRRGEMGKDLFSHNRMNCSIGEKDTYTNKAQRGERRNTEGIFSCLTHAHSLLEVRYRVLLFIIEWVTLDKSRTTIREHLPERRLSEVSSSVF
jgi:phage gpG-like protein